jgi:hypothetical protein
MVVNLYQTWLLSVVAVPPIIAIMITLAITITIVVVIVVVVIDSSDRGISIDSINDSTKVFMPNI